jgi:hypothetical protein
MQEKTASQLAADINRSNLAVEKGPGVLTRYRAVAVVSREEASGARDFGVRLSAGDEDEFVIWDPGEFDEARAVHSSQRRRRLLILSGVMAPLLVLLFGSRAIYELVVEHNTLFAIVLGCAAVASLWYGRWIVGLMALRRRRGR